MSFVYDFQTSVYNNNKTSFDYYFVIPEEYSFVSLPPHTPPLTGKLRINELSGFIAEWVMATTRDVPV